MKINQFFNISDARHVLYGDAPYSCDKLTSTLKTKKNFVVHYNNLRLYLQLGLELRKVHKVLSFEQRAFLRPYIDFCTENRAKSQTSFETGCWKLMCNAVFGKFIEQKRNYQKCALTLTQKSFENQVSNVRFVSSKIINEELVLAFSTLSSITMDKAYAVGFTILEASKMEMISAYYQKIVPLLQAKRMTCSVLFSDTDSFCLKIESPKKRNVLKILRGIMDFSNFPTSHRMYSSHRKNKLGFFKSEVGASDLLEFCGLRSKTYSMRYSSNSGAVTSNRAKGVQKCRSKALSFQTFKKCLSEISKVQVKQFHIRSQSHTLTTTQVSKIAFSSFDDKRYLLCSIHSCPYGSDLIRQSKLVKSGCVFCSS